MPCRVDVPIDEGVDTVFVRVACGSNHSLSIDDKGALFAWGCGSHGKLGHGDSNARYVPTRVAALEGASNSTVRLSTFDYCLLRVGLLLLLPPTTVQALLLLLLWGALITRQQSQMEVWFTLGDVLRQVDSCVLPSSKMSQCISQANLATALPPPMVKMTSKPMLLNLCRLHKLSKCLKVTATSYIHLFSSIIDMDPQFSFYSLKLMVFLRKPCDKCFVWR